VLAYVPDATPDWLARQAAPNLRFAAAPVDLNATARDADALVTYASVATTTAFLLAGKPVLMLPGHLEQFLTAQRVVEMGAGVLQHPEQPPTELAALLARVLHDPVPRDNARAFARKYAQFDQAAVLGHLVRRIEAIINTITQPSEDDTSHDRPTDRNPA
jgi:UDP:flavonoid glycosyltransferase YjiC (YdhE family)